MVRKLPGLREIRQLISWCGAVESTGTDFSLMVVAKPGPNMMDRAMLSKNATVSNATMSGMCKFAAIENR